MKNHFAVFTVLSALLTLQAVAFTTGYSVGSAHHHGHAPHQLKFHKCMYSPFHKSVGLFSVGSQQRMGRVTVNISGSKLRVTYSVKWCSIKAVHVHLAERAIRRLLPHRLACKKELRWPKNKVTIACPLRLFSNVPCCKKFFTYVHASLKCGRKRLEVYGGTPSCSRRVSRGWGRDKKRSKTEFLCNVISVKPPCPRHCKCNRKCICPGPNPSTSSSPMPSMTSSPMPSMTSSPIPSMSSSPMPSMSSSPIPSMSSSPIPSMSRSPMPSMSRSPMPSMSRSPMPSMSSSPIPSMSSSPIPSMSSSPMPSMSSSPMPSMSSSPIPSMSSSPIPSMSSSPIPSMSSSPMPSMSSSPIPSMSSSPIPSMSSSPIPSMSSSPIPSMSSSPIPSMSSSPIPSMSSSPIPSMSRSPIPSMSSSPIPSMSSSPIPSMSSSPIPSMSSSPIPSMSSSPMPSMSSSPIPSMSSSPIPSMSSSALPSVSPSPSACVCPNCFICTGIDGSGNSICEPDTSTNDAECNPCEGAGDQFCEDTGLPNAFKCCPPSSLCKSNTIPSRLGVSQNDLEVSFVCSRNCGGVCANIRNDGTSNACALFSPLLLNNDMDSGTDDVLNLCPDVSAQ